MSGARTGAGGKTGDAEEGRMTKDARVKNASAKGASAKEPSAKGASAKGPSAKGPSAKGPAAKGAPMKGDAVVGDLSADAIPAGFRLLPMPRNPFIDGSGPLYGRFEDGRFTLGLRIEERHTNPGGVCHGGMVMTFADITLLMVASIQGGVDQYMVTVNLTTDFLAPAPVGAWLEGRGEVLRKSRNFVFVQGTLAVGDTLVARINGIMKPTGDVDTRFSAERYFK